MWEKQYTVIIDNKKFRCAEKFLDHLMKTRVNEYFPCREVQKMQNQTNERKKQLVLSIRYRRIKLIKI